MLYSAHEGVFINGRGLWSQEEIIDMRQRLRTTSSVSEKMFGDSKNHVPDDLRIEASITAGVNLAVISLSLTGILDLDNQKLVREDFKKKE